MAALAWALLAFDLPMPKWSAQIIGGRRASFGTPDPWPRLLASGYWASAVNTNDNDQGLAVSWLTHEDMHKKPTTTLNIKHPCPITAEIDQNCLKASQPLPFECLAMQHNHLPAETAINWNCESVCVCVNFLGGVTSVKCNDWSKLIDYKNFRKISQKKTAHLVSFILWEVSGLKREQHGN